MKGSDKFEKFTELTDRLLSVPHAQIKEKIDAEKRRKRRKKSKTSSVLGRV